MEFNVLGPVQVKVGGHIVELGPRMHRALLALLVIDAGRVVSVDRILDALWGEHPPPTATNALQGYVSSLRRALEPDRPPRAPPRLLLTQPPGYVLRVAPAAVDAARFETAVTKGQALLAQGHPSQARETLVAGLALWRDTPFADLAFESFVQPEVRRLTELHAAATEDLAEVRLAMGEVPIAELEALVEAHPLRERRWRLLMLGLYRAGRQADALRAYAKARRTLVEELGIEPTPALRQLEDDILNHAPDLDRTRRASVASVPLPLAGATGPFVGRTAELEAVHRAIDEAFGGRGKAVLISGEPGIGKTRLASELALKAAARGGLVAWGRCVEGDGAPAFWPWTQTLRALTTAPDAEAARAELGPAMGELALLVPELRATSAGGHLDVDPEKARVLLYDAVCRFVRSLAARVPIVLILDDIHWADRASLHLLRFAAMELGGCRVLLVGTYRHSEAASPDLVAALADLGRAGSTQVRLSGLAPVEIGRLVSASTGTTLTEQLVGELSDRTGGNPFFVGQLVTLLDTGSAGRNRAFATEVPTGVRDVIRQRVTALPHDAGSVLTVAAVIGREFDLPVLATTAGRDEEEVLSAVEAGLRAALVTEAPEAVGRYRFVHALVTETLYDELSGVRRARLHARVGEALEHAGETDPVPLAHHFWRGVPAGTGEKALRYALAAAEHARDRRAYEDAEAQLRRALEIIGSLPAGAERARRELEVQGRLWVLLAPLHGYADADAAQSAERARALCMELGDSRPLRGPLWGLWVFHTIRAEFDRAEAYAREMFTAHRSDGDPLFLLAAHHGLGIVAMHRGELTAASEHLQAAVSVADTVDERAMVENFGYHPRVIHRSNLATVLALLGESSFAATTVDDARTLAAERSHPYTSALCLFFEAWTDVHLGDVQLARDRSEEALLAFDEGGFRMWPAAAGVIRGWAEAMTGAPDAGAADAAHALEAWEATGARAFRPFLRGLLAEAEWRAGRSQDALALVEEALGIAGATADRFYAVELHRLHGELVLERIPEARSEAEASLRQAVALAEHQGARVMQRRARERLAGLLAAPTTPR